MSVPQKTRERLLVEVSHRCSRCLSSTPELDVHHISPRGEGGSDEESNLIVLCPTCHRLAHRYRFSAFQLRLYKRRASALASGHAFAIEPFFFTTPTIADACNTPPSVSIPKAVTPPKDRSQGELLRGLLRHIKGWYNDYVEALVAAERERGGTPDEVLLYIMSRNHMPDVVAIRDVLSALHGFEDLCSDIEVFLDLLTLSLPSDGAICRFRQVSSAYHPYDGTPDLALPNVYRQLLAISRSIYERLATT